VGELFHTFELENALHAFAELDFDSELNWVVMTVFFLDSHVVPSVAPQGTVANEFDETSTA
jgi:hypothetical protein